MLYTFLLKKGVQIFTCKEFKAIQTVLFKRNEQCKVELQVFSKSAVLTEQMHYKYHKKQKYFYLFN